MMPKDPMPRKRGSTEIRSGALLLPALLRSDWQPSSSQLPIILNDARRTSSPGGRYCLRRAHGDARQSAASSLKSPSPAQDLRIPRSAPFTPCASRMGAIPSGRFKRGRGRTIRKPSGRATISSSNVPDRIGGPSSSQAADRHQQSPPDLLPRRALFLRRT